MVHRRLWFQICLGLLTAMWITVFGFEQAQAQTTELSFTRDIRPILSNHCWACHGPDAENRQADLRLDIDDDVDFDEVLYRLESDDPDEIMPPPEHHKELSDEQISKLKQWIESGAPFERHWAFTPVKQPELPSVASVATELQPIDQFVLARLDRSDLRPSDLADKRTSIRRLTFDLTGLPPSVEDVRAFLNDDSEDAYEKVVDRLLASPQYGEHMARYWLDLVRFADTNGLHHDHYRQMTPYRDWVIRSFNDNLPFDDFTRYQLAGDLYESPTQDQLIASGFNRLHLIIDRGTALPEESLNRNVIDRVTAVGTAFMGLTVQCASCHDHKYDPITQKEFYELYAFFNNFDGGPETGGRQGNDFQRGLQPPYIELSTNQQKEELAVLNGKLKSVREEIAELEKLDSQRRKEFEKENLSAAAPPKFIPSEELVKARNVEKRLNAEKNKLLEQIPAAMVMREKKKMRQAYVLVRGEYDNLGEKVGRSTPAFLPPLKSESEVASRMDLANWLVQPDHPLMARVTVNRFWQQFFGVGLVKTSEDFGAQGESPSHPLLLDYLTTSFIESGWNVKQLVRNVVLSRTYRQSSKASPERFREDPENRMLARGSRFRLDAEMIRDQILMVTGRLNLEMYGKSVKPPQPGGLWKLVAMPSSYPRVFKADEGAAIYRRSLYSFWKRALPPPQMTILDAPMRESCIARRERTNTPLQALLLMNEEQYFCAAMTLAHEITQQDFQNDEARIAFVHERITAQIPGGKQLKSMLNSLSLFREHYLADEALAASMITKREDVPASIRGITSHNDRAELAAWTLLVHAILNSDAARNRE